VVFIAFGQVVHVLQNQVVKMIVNLAAFGLAEIIKEIFVKVS